MSGCFRPCVLTCTGAHAKTHTITKVKYLHRNLYRTANPSARRTSDILPRIRLPHTCPHTQTHARTRARETHAQLRTDSESEKTRRGAYRWLHSHMRSHTQDTHTQRGKTRRTGDTEDQRTRVRWCKYTKPARACVHTHTHTHTRTHTHTHTHAHTHTLICRRRQCVKHSSDTKDKNMVYM